MRRVRFWGVMVGLIAAVLVAGALWLVLYAPFVANEPKVIQARNAYFDQLDKWGAVDALFYTFRPLAILEEGERGVYKYKWIGHLARMEYAEKVLVGRDRRGKEWRFRYPTYSIPGDHRDDEYKLLAFTEARVGRERQVVSKVRYMVLNMREPGQTTPYFLEGDLIAIFWKDERSVVEVGQAQEAGEVIELQNAGVIPITRVVEGEE